MGAYSDRLTRSALLSFRHVSEVGQQSALPLFPPPHDAPGQSPDCAHVAAQNPGGKKPPSGGGCRSFPASCCLPRLAAPELRAHVQASDARARVGATPAAQLNITQRAAIADPSNGAASTPVAVVNKTTPATAVNDAAMLNVFAARSHMARVSGRRVRAAMHSAITSGLPSRAANAAA